MSSASKRHSTWRRPAAASCVFAWATLAAAQLQARPPMLPGSAFVESQARPCAVDPFGDAGPAQREQQLVRTCGAESLQFNAEGLRLQPAATPGPTPFKFGFDQLLSTNITSFFTTNFRLGWTGSHQEKLGGLQTDRALVAAGGMLRLDRDFAVDMNVGRDGLRTRTTMGGTWRQADERMMFAQLAEEPTGTASIVGLRLWLVPKRVSFDFMAKRSPDGQVIEPRFELSVKDLGR